jgi:hypothetical protein
MEILQGLKRKKILDFGPIKKPSANLKGRGEVVGGIIGNEEIPVGRITV